MKKGILLVLVLCTLAAVVRADLLITEIMYNPNQADDTDAEWIELYNSGGTIDLSEWQLNSNALSGTLLSGEFVVVAKELTDGSDTDTDSFESIWGNNDGVWDEQDGFMAIDGSFSLANSAGSVNLSSGLVSEYLAYESSWGANGNGMSLERVNFSMPNTMENWNESIGTPGKWNSLTQKPEGIMVRFSVMNVLPAINITLSPDEMDDAGIQLVAKSSNRTLDITAEIEDLNGADDIANVTAELEGATVFLSRINANSTRAVFKGSFQLGPYDEKKLYSVKVTAFDSLGNSSKTAEFEYVGTIATVLETTSLDFGSLMPGKVSEAGTIAIRNNGTVTVKVSFSASFDSIDSENIEAFVEEWLPLEQAEFTIEPGEREEIQVRIDVPNTKPSSYNGRIQVIAAAL